MNKLLVDEDLAAWKLYLRWQLLRTAAPSASATARATPFLFESALHGQKEQPPNWRRCTARQINLFGEALGQVYVGQVSTESEARAQNGKGIEAAMGRDIVGCAWMQPATKREAHFELAAVVDKIGYPDKWMDYESSPSNEEAMPPTWSAERHSN